MGAERLFIHKLNSAELTAFVLHGVVEYVMVGHGEERPENPIAGFTFVPAKIVDSVLLCRTRGLRLAISYNLIIIAINTDN